MSEGDFVVMLSSKEEEEPEEAEEELPPVDWASTELYQLVEE